VVVEDCVDVVVVHDAVARIINEEHGVSAQCCVLLSQASPLLHLKLKIIVSLVIQIGINSEVEVC